MNRISLREFSENVSSILVKSKNEAYLTVSQQIEGSYGDENDCNFEWAEEHNIPVYNINRSAGTNIYAAGNIEFVLIVDTKYGWVCEKFGNALIEYLKKRIDGEHTYEFDHNDVLIDNYKVSSGVEMQVGANLEKIYAGIQISINQDIEAIKHICKKEMVKIPKALSDFGITTEEIVEFCDAWWDEYVVNVINVE